MDFQEMFFSFDGRLNRKPYILRFLLRNAIIWCLGYLIGSLFAPDGTMFQILAFALTFIAALSCLSLYVRRLHDLDHGSLMVLLAFIPLISFFFAVYLFLWCLRRCRIGHDACGRNGYENRPCRVFRRGRAFQRVCCNRLQCGAWHSPVLYETKRNQGVNIYEHHSLCDRTNQSRRT